MKSTIKLLISVLVLGIFASAPLLRAADEAPPAKGQKGGKGGGRGMQSPDQQVARLDEAVTLTADQKTKALAIYTKAAADIQAIPQEERQAKMREMGQATRDQIRALLTDEQKTKFDAMPQPGRGGKKKNN